MFGALWYRPRQALLVVLERVFPWDFCSADVEQVAFEFWSWLANVEPGVLMTVGENVERSPGSSSYDYLTPGQQRMFRRLGLHPSRGPDVTISTCTGYRSLNVPTISAISAAFSVILPLGRVTAAEGSYPGISYEVLLRSPSK